ncbi:MAG TPA: CorA family divalent cation transporter [Luteibacter sp.]|nr:CorA family divalent cation transporter [Luteibacter sp.]
MLTLHQRGADAGPNVWKPGDPLPDGVVWLDMLDPDEEERRCANAATHLRIPERHDISNLTLSSRIRTDDGAIYLAVPYFADCDGSQPPAPLGIVLTPRILLTLRYAPSKSFELASRICSGQPLESSADVITILLEAIVNLAAERMELIAAELKKLSDRVFSDRRMRTPELRDCMLEVGRLEGMQTRTRSSLLGVQRVVSFIRGKQPDWISDENQARLHVVDHDLRTLDEFDDQLTNKLAFLLDASLGFINTDQNHVMKVLTVASVATIPPVILAGIWGMNFKNMPELDWWWGYPLALGAIALSIILPMLWFRSRGWLTGD